MKTLNKGDLLWVLLLEENMRWVVFSLWTCDMMSMHQNVEYQNLDQEFSAKSSKTRQCKDYVMPVS